jgi:hypothetical protein
MCVHSLYRYDITVETLNRSKSMTIHLSDALRPCLVGVAVTLLHTTHTHTHTHTPLGPNHNHGTYVVCDHLLYSVGRFDSVPRHMNI